MNVDAIEQCTIDNTTELLQQPINEDKIIKKKKIVFFVRQGLDNFLNDIIQSLSTDFESKKMIITEYDQIDEGIQWADIAWFEWCDELVAYGSNLEKVEGKYIVCRLHSYEAFTDYPSRVQWKNIDKLIFVGEPIRKFVIENFRVDDGITEVIPNGIDIDKYTFKERKSGFNIAYVGYINYKKGPMLLLHTFKAIFDKDHRYRLYIAGQFQDNRDVLYFKQMIKEFGIENNLFFQGWQDNLDAWLEDKDYILCTSVLESQNMSVMQAMAKGIKPIIHHFVGAREIYDNKYIWNTVNEAIEMLETYSYSSWEYRTFIESRYSFKLQMNRIDNLLKKNYIKKPFVTVGIINYNYARYIEDSVISVLTQTYDNFEILIIDDCSTDESQNIIDKYTKNYKNIRAIYHDKNSGSAARAFQEVIKYGMGEYFITLSSDDLFSDKYSLEMYMNQMFADNSLDYVYGNIKTCDEFMNEKDVWTYSDYTDDEVILQIYKRKGSGIIPFSAGLFRKEFYTKNNLTWFQDRNNRVAGDTLNTLINIKYGWKRKYVNHNIVSYRQHSNNMTYDLSNRIKSIISVMEYIINNFNESKYLEGYNWEELKGTERESLKNYLIGESYYEAYNIYSCGQGMPWEHKLDFDIEQIKEFLQPLVVMMDKYFKNSLDISERYNSNITTIKGKIEKDKVFFNFNKSSEEDLLQGQIVSKGMALKNELLEEYKNKYGHRNLKNLIYSPSNGFWKYSFMSWQMVLNHMGVNTDIVYQLDSEKDYSSYNCFITIAEGSYIRNSMSNNTINNIKHKIGIASKQFNDLEADLFNITLCKALKFEFLISSMVDEENVNTFSEWLKNEINILSVPFGFNPLIHYPEKTDKLYDYFFVGTNSYLKISETENFILPIINKYKGVLRGTGWGEHIPELNPNNTNFFYNRSKINLNYHMKIQKQIRNEVNERTFIIGACGGFQLVDQPLLLSEYYDETELAIGYSEEEFIQKFEYFMNKPIERLEKSYNLLVKTYGNNCSLFERLDKIIRKII